MALPHQQLDPHDVLAATSVIMEALKGQQREVAFAGCAVASFMLYRGPTSPDREMEDLQEFIHWLASQEAQDES